MIPCAGKGIIDQGCIIDEVRSLQFAERVPKSHVRFDFLSVVPRVAGALPPVFAPREDAMNNLGKRCSNARLLRELRIQLSFPNAQAGLMHAWATESPD